MVARNEVVAIGIICFFLGVQVGSPGPLDWFTRAWIVVAIFWLSIAAISMFLSWISQTERTDA